MCFWPKTYLETSCNAFSCIPGCRACRSPQKIPVRSIYREAALGKDDDERKAIAAWAFASESNKAVKLYEIAKAAVTGTRPELGEHRALRMR